MPIPLLSTEQVSKRFGYRTIFQQVTFDLFPEEFILLIGNNGTGKSTLFRLLCSLSHPSSGTLRFNSCPYRECLPEVRRNIGFLGHESRLYHDLSAMENLRNALQHPGTRTAYKLRIGRGGAGHGKNFACPDLQ